MGGIGLLKNTIQEYAWGSYTAIPDLLGGESPSTSPQAELWMGAHPKAPSMVKNNGKWCSLLELIAENPREFLGEKVAEKFDNRLPYLFKVLAASKPLSIQAHPDLFQAKEGFQRENRLGIPMDAPNRNYRDDNHKPECICALTLFWALNGFREISRSISLLDRICPQGLKKGLHQLRGQPDSSGLKIFFQTLMTMPQNHREEIVREAVKNAEKVQNDSPAYRWMVDLYREYPSDTGVFSPIILNLICLKPGEAMFLPAGELHAYLDGVGIELMANSDNVLRGGLTPKHVDVEELLKVLNFQARDVSILFPKPKIECEWAYKSYAEEFILSVISVKKNMCYLSPDDRSVEILLCTAGEAAIADPAKNDKILVSRGTSVIIPASVENYCIEGDATFYKAAVPM